MYQPIRYYKRSNKVVNLKKVLDLNFLEKGLGYIQNFNYYGEPPSITAYDITTGAAALTPLIVATFTKLLTVMV